MKLHLRREFSLLNPRKNLSHFCDYLSIIDRIYLDRDKRIIRRIKLINILLLVQLVRLIYLGSDPTLTKWQRTVHFDGIYTMMAKSQLNLTGISFLLLVLYHNHVLCNSVHLGVMNFLKTILVHQDHSFFIEPKYKGKPICERIRLLFERLLIFHESYTLMLGWFINKFIFWKNN